VIHVLFPQATGIRRRNTEGLTMETNGKAVGRWAALAAAMFLAACSGGSDGSNGVNGAGGAVGPAGPVGLQWKGAWSAAADYVAQDGVSHNGSSWVANAPNTNTEPGVGAAWDVIAAAATGIQGEQGPAGPEGPVGPAGPQGPQGVPGNPGDVGLQGPAGPLGPAGPAGPQGPQGPQGATGATGSTGPAGPAGPQGSQGAAGPQGPVGPSGLVSQVTVTAGNEGISSGGCNGIDGMAFFGATAGVALAANQTVTVSGTANLGADLTPVSNLSLNVCYQPAGGAIVADGEFFGAPGTPLQLPAGTLVPFSLSRSWDALTAGSYTVGLCGCIDGTDPWVTDWSWLTVTVSQQ
jgi:hypothetical protein